MTTEHPDAGRLLGRREVLKKGAAILAALTAAGAVATPALADEEHRKHLKGLIHDFKELGKDLGDALAEEADELTPPLLKMVLQGFQLYIEGIIKGLEGFLNEELKELPKELVKEAIREFEAALKHLENGIDLYIEFVKKSPGGAQ